MLTEIKKLRNDLCLKFITTMVSQSPLTTASTQFIITGCPLKDPQNIIKDRYTSQQFIRLKQYTQPRYYTKLSNHRRLSGNAVIPELSETRFD
ncbi:hypothetical protein FGO68_gene17670 [Halteria grandinella]|uniref:Uncharacterized protein n=1 Tax=Halteria grandinella TaxID=5974 RepID=A0A8J8T8R6_HALGN|nr:hypothetical protein FGO68_gene17670 [Halteria grandinella]